MTAIAGSIFTAAQFNTHVRDNLLETAPAKATVAGRHFATSSVNEIAERVTETSIVTTTDTTSSTAYTDLDTTMGPAVTVDHGPRVLVMVSAAITNVDTAATVRFSYAASGTASITANDNTCGAYTREGSTTAPFGGRFTSVSLRVVSAGTSTFTMKYRTTAGTATFADRTLVVMPF